MDHNSDDRRQHHALRAHIDMLLEAGASLEGRDPVRLSIDGQSLLVRHGMLIGENGHLDVIGTLSSLDWASERQRNQAIEMCLHHLAQAIDETELTLERWVRDQA